MHEGECGGDHDDMWRTDKDICWTCRRRASEFMAGNNCKDKGITTDCRPPEATDCLGNYFKFYYLLIQEMQEPNTGR